MKPHFINENAIYEQLYTISIADILSDDRGGDDDNTDKNKTKCVKCDLIITYD